MGVITDMVPELLSDSAKELERQANAVLEAAKRDIPIGDPAEDPDPAVSLAASGRIVMDVAPLTGRVTAYITFDTPYAIKQHESFHLHHPRGGGPRFLENNVLEHAAAMNDELAVVVSATTRKGRTRRKAA
jgi:hypothetical protein